MFKLLRRFPVRFLGLCVAGLLLACSGAAWADGDQGRRLLTFTLENDFFVGEDNGYTNGLGLIWARGGLTEFDDSVPSWLRAIGNRLYIGTMADKRRAISFSLAQVMQTPNDLARSDLIRNEAPYLGMLLASANLHAFDARVADTLSLTLGVAGPVSGGETLQKLAHDILGSEDPKGWSNQVKNEVVFQVRVERLWRLAALQSDGGLGLDVIGIGQAAVGTVRSNLVSGLSLRYGRALERSFPAATVMPGREVNPLAGSAERSWSLFFNLLGAYVANDIAIDGNTFRDSHSVPLKHWQGMAVVGLSYSFGHWAVLLSAVQTTDHYENQPDPTRFGSLSLTYAY
ncbi:MAG: lipid A deacylase LpxR family protein [Xanthomonadaceae bacterium]|nr:lipid A deacylase LpxR family protein [Xanthomonadaceae bacterium]